MTSLQQAHFKQPQIVSWLYINVGSVGNKLEGLQEFLAGDVDFLAAAETKTDSTFPASQFIFSGFTSNLLKKISYLKAEI